MPAARHWSSTAVRAASRSSPRANTPFHTRRSSASELPLASAAVAWRISSSVLSSMECRAPWRLRAMGPPTGCRARGGKGPNREYRPRSAAGKVSSRPRPAALLGGDAERDQVLARLLELGEARWIEGRDPGCAFPTQEVREVERACRRHAQAVPREAPADREVVRGVQPADERPAVAREPHRARPAMLDRDALRDQLAEPALDATLDPVVRRHVVAHLAVEVELAPAADDQAPIRHLPPVVVAPMGVGRARRDLA